jgi:hypothetical protein
MCFEKKSVMGLVIVEKAKSFYDEMKLTDKCTLSKGWLQNFKVTAAEGDIQMEYCSD